MERVDLKRIMILKILSEEDQPLSSQVIKERMQERGMELSERTVRFHMLALDKAGFTEYKEKKGRYLTTAGFKEIARNQVYDRVGFLSSRIDDLSYQMNFNWKKRKGTVLVNVTLIPLENSSVVYHLMAPIFESGLTMGQKVVVFNPGEKVGDVEVPPGFFGLGTVCSITLNGVFLSCGIPVTSVFGGLLEVSGSRPDRFSAIINYNGTSLDPLEIFISSGMTNCRGAAEAGHGFIGASFREIPASSLDEVSDIHQHLSEMGLGGILKVGYSGHSLLDIPVADGRVGLITAGGLNSISALVEADIQVKSKALSGLIEYDRLVMYTDLYDILNSIRTRG
jgi:repressor of nif and glnA expression